MEPNTDYSIPGFSDDSSVRRSPTPALSTPSPANMLHTEPESDGPVIRVAASRTKRIITETTGHGNALVMDSKHFLQHFIGRKLAKKYNCGIMWLIKDYCGLFCAVMTWSLIGYAEFVMWFVVAPANVISYLNLALWQVFAFLAFFSHSRAMLSDPGAIPIGNCTMENLRRLGYSQPKTVDGTEQAPTIVYKCPRCACIKPDKSHHCSICKRCIFKMDHHCPWVNNCVGMLNQKFFILFTLYICLMSAHAIIISLQFLFTCFSYVDPHAASRYEQESPDAPSMCLRPPRAGSQDSPHFISLSAGIIFVIFMLFEAVIFSLFTAIMCGTQIHAVCTEISTVDAIKMNERGDAEAGMSRQAVSDALARKRHDSESKGGKGCLSPLGETFGDKRPPGLLWLSPFHNHELHKPGFLEPHDDGSLVSAFLSSIRTA